MEMWITAIATGVIAIYAFMSYRLASKIRTKDDEYRQQINDLFQAIVISNLLAGPGLHPRSENLQMSIDQFKKYYQGKTPIFD